jgi:hypothetical protein
VVGKIKNVNGSARHIYALLGDDNGSNYNWSVIDQYSATQINSCYPSSFIELTDSTSGVNRFANAAWAQINIRFTVYAANVLGYEGHQTVTGNDQGSTIPADNHTIGNYVGTSPTTITIGLDTVSACTSQTPSSTSMTGTIYVYANPF